MMMASAVPPYLPKEQRLDDKDDDESYISRESSIHVSDYDSEDSSADECFYVEDGREASTISKSSLASQSFSTAVAATNQQGLRSSSPRKVITADTMSPETSSSSSSGDDGWITESSSASCVSSSGENGSEYDEARRKLQSRQKRRTNATKEAGNNFSRPIDVEQLWHSRLSTPSSLTRQRLGLDDVDDLSRENSPSEGHRIVGFVQSSSRKAMVQGNQVTTKRAIHSIPQEVPLSRYEDDVSTIGGRTLLSYRDLVRLVRQQRGTDIEKGYVQGTDPQRGKICASHRSDVEMFLILVIAASLVALVVLLATILKSRE
jgi:hypothetical protein